MKNLLRKESLEKLTSPEQLDRLLVIIRVPGWISLFVLILLIAIILIWSVVGRIPVTSEGLSVFYDPNSIEVMQVGNKAFVEEIFVEEGDEVEKGKRLMTLKELNNETTNLVAPENGRVLLIETLEGEGVDFGQNLIWFQNYTEKAEKLIYAFFSVAEGEAIQPGMKAHVVFDAVNTEIYGKMIGEVKKVLRFSGEPQGGILLSIPSTQLRNYLSSNEATVVVIIEPKRDSSTPSGYAWTTDQGPPYAFQADALGSTEVFIEEKRPITYLIPIGGD